MTDLPPLPPLTARFRPRPGVLVRELEGEAVLLDVETGRYFGLNATGLRIFDLLDGERSLEEVLRVLGSEYEANPAQLQAEVLHLLAELRAAKLILAVGVVL